MNATDQAKNSFKTFLITLAVSLVLFSTVYFIAANYGNTVDIESSNFEVQNYTPENNVDAQEPVVEQQAVVTEETTGIFGELAQQPLALGEAEVLGAGTTGETTQSTVPSTGVSAITYSFIISSALVILGFYLLVWEPRKRALRSFEKRVTRGL